MGKYVTRCGKGVGELAVMEVTQVVGVRTRARALALAAAAAAADGKRRKAAADPSDLAQTSAYLQLRSRRLVMTRRPPRNSAAGETQAPTAEEASLCLSNASSEVAEVDDLESSMCNSNSQREREMALEREARREEGDLESTAGVTASPRSAKATSTETEIDEFFAGAEREQAQRFADRYNYDVINDVPLDGRFGWVRINL